MATRFTASKPFMILVGTGGRTAFRQQLVSDQSSRNRMGLFAGNPADSTGTIAVSDVSVFNSSTIYLGEYRLFTGINWVPVVGDANATATSLAAAIDNLPDFSAVSVGADVDITGPKGPSGIRFEVVYQDPPVNFSFTPDSGELAVGGPAMGAPEVL